MLSLSYLASNLRIFLLTLTLALYRYITVHYMPKCMNYHGTTGGLVITGRTYCLWIQTCNFIIFTLYTCRDKTYLLTCLLNASLVLTQLKPVVIVFSKTSIIVLLVGRAIIIFEISFQYNHSKNLQNYVFEG